MKYLIVLVSLLILNCATAQQMSILERIATFHGNPLFPYIHCKCDSGLSIVAIDQLPADAEKSRSIHFGKRIETVSVTDGFRVIYVYDGRNYPFANIKIESSDPGNYLSDKEKIIRYLKYLSDSAKGNRPEYHNL